MTPPSSAALAADPGFAPPTTPGIAARPSAEGRRAATWRDYAAIMRLDHSTKHVFVVPGLVLAWALQPGGAVPVPSPLTVLAGFLVAVLVASANYTINEWLDRSFDAHHPEKSARTAVGAEMSGALVWAQWAALAGLGLALAWWVGALFFWAAAAFAASGIVYNVEPLRSKDKPYLDVLSESLNNPIRLVLGWAMVSPDTLPPSSLLIAYWMGGAFLMGAKRLSEYRDISAEPGGLAVLHLYRRSFRTYTEERLVVSVFLYALLAAFATAVFLVKYKIEYVLAMPPLALLFALYLHLSLRRGSVAQKPERLFRERRLMALSAGLCVLLLVLTVVEIPVLEYLSVPHYVGVGPAPAAAP